MQVRHTCQVTFVVGDDHGLKIRPSPSRLGIGEVGLPIVSPESQGTPLSTKPTQIETLKIKEKMKRGGERIWLVFLRYFK